MTTLYVVGNHELDYNDEYYIVQDGMNPTHAFTNRSEAESSCREMNIQYLREFGNAPLQAFDRSDRGDISNAAVITSVFEALRTYYGNSGLETLLNLDPGELDGGMLPETYGQIEEMYWNKLPESLVGKLVDILHFNIYYIQEVPLGE